MATFSKQRIERRMRLRRSDRKRRPSVMQRLSLGSAQEAPDVRLAEQLAGMPEAFKEQLARVQKRLPFFGLRRSAAR